MFCKHCGKPHDDGSAFCEHCGAQIAPMHSVPAVPQIIISQEENPVIPPIPPVPAAAPVSCPTPPQPTPFPAYPVPPVSYPTPAVPISSAPGRRGTLRIPLIFLSVMSVIGLVLYFLFPLGGDVGDAGVSSQTPWLVNLDGSVYFYAEIYSGSEEVTLPETVNGETVTHIGEMGFFDCDGITTVILPDTLEGIRYQGFAHCDQLRGIFIPEGVTYIGEEAFAYCSGLEAICIPASVETLESDAFNGCSSLRHIFYSGTMEQWEELYSSHINRHTTVYCSDGEIPWG